MLRTEARRRNLSVEREVLRTISAEWRREFGLGVLVDKSVEHYETQAKPYAGLVIASLRNPGEADRVHELGGTVVWVDADSLKRYDRIQQNAASRDRAEEDNRTYEQFLADEAAEMSSTGDAATLNMSGVKSLADSFLTNNGNELEPLAEAIGKTLL